MSIYNIEEFRQKYHSTQRHTILRALAQYSMPLSRVVIQHYKVGQNISGMQW